MTAADRNAHYGTLNVRFDARAAQLRGLGYRYERLEAYDVAVFTKVAAGRRKSIAAGSVMNADEVVWQDDLERLARV